jgi:STAS domain
VDADPEGRAVAHRRAAESGHAVATSFIGSFPDEGRPGQGLITLRGDIDAATVDRLRVHIDDLVAAGTRILGIDMSAAAGCDVALLDLLGHTQHRLNRRRGLLHVQGLHPSLLSSPDPDAELDPSANREEGRRGSRHAANTARAASAAAADGDGVNAGEARTPVPPHSDEPAAARSRAARSRGQGRNGRRPARRLHC